MITSRSTLLLGLAAMVLATGAAAADPFPEVAGWQRQGEVLDLGPEDLWKHIDGAAEVFLAYDVRLLRACDLVGGGRMVTVSLYDMGSPLNAFGIYGTERPAGGAPLPIGAEAVIAAPYQGLMFKGHHYVKVESWQGDLDEESARDLLAAVAAALPGDGRLPPELALLPAEGRVPGSVGYTRESFLGLADLRRCVHAEYRPGQGDPFRGFLMLPDGEGSVAGTWAGLSGKWRDLNGAERPVKVRQVPYEGPVLVTPTETGLLGVAGLPDETASLAALRLLLPGP